LKNYILVISLKQEEAAPCLSFCQNNKQIQLHLALSFSANVNLSQENSSWTKLVKDIHKYTWPEGSFGGLFLRGLVRGAL
jgi:hypothetical protein